CQQNSNWHLTF
nr:immunoglobulin light chain junction region [Macaca mulatta]